MVVRRFAGAVLTVAILGTATAPLSGAPVVALDTDFDTLIEEWSETMLVRFPQEVTELGLSTRLGLAGDDLDDLSRDYQLETAGLAQNALDQLAGLDRAALTPEQRITLAVTEWYLADVVTMAEYLDHEYAVNYITGAHANFPEFMADVHPLTNSADADAYVERLRRSATQMRQVADNLARAEGAGNLPTETGIGIAAWQIDNQLTSTQRDALVSDLGARLTSVDMAGPERERIVNDARTAVENEMLPAYRDLLDTVRSSAARSDDHPGVLEHPGGEDYYAAALRHHTTTSLSPSEVHRIGGEQVDRVRSELSDALSTAGFDVESLGLAGAIEAASSASPSVPLRSDDDREALLGATEDFIAEAQSAFAGMFTMTPTSSIEVQRPRPGREGASGAYYRPPPAIGERPGIYYLSLAGDAFGTATYATTNYHEAVPGHHFQIALQRESADLPLIQRAATFTGYAEGWALYAERLAYEAGLYADDPLGDIGRLRMELLRAARAVVDTGIHALGWSKWQAVDYLVDLGFPTPWAAAEVDRYIVWPGQAPAYLLGMLEILRLRAEAEAALGADFDLTGFHDAVLGHGSVPVEVLDQIVAGYIDAAS